MSARILRFAVYAAIAVSLLSAPLPAADGKDDIDIDLPVLVDAFRKHCVKVYVHAKTHNGKSPTTGDFADDIRNERPTLFGGYWWDERHVVMPDPVIADDFVRNVEIGVPFSERRYPARIAGRFANVEAMLLEVLPGEDGVPPRARPLSFEDGDIEKAVILGYEWDRGEWRVKAHAAVGAAGITDGGLETVDIGANGLFVTPEGKILGLAFGKRLGLGVMERFWQGGETARTPLLDAKTLNQRAEAMREALRRSVLETKFRLRVKIDDDDDAMIWSFDPDADAMRSSEIVAAGFVTGPRHLLVPVAMNAEAIARIEEIAVVLDAGRETRARFVGACREYMAVVVETEEELPTADLPEGFAMLNPLVLPNEAFDPDTAATAAPVFEYLSRWHIDYSLGRRREVNDYDRWLGTFRGYRSDTVVMTHTNEPDGGLAFDSEGRLRAVALTPRLLAANEEQRSAAKRAARQNAGFRPIDSLHKRLQSPDVFDPALVPVDEEDGKRLVDLGIEYQALDKNTAKLFFVERQSRGGDIGMLVTHVYDGSDADRIGLREHDVLLRIFIEGRAEPIELKVLKGEGPETFFNIEDASAESMSQFMSAMPPPWPSRENSLTTVLTAAGVGKRATIEYVREGETRTAEFVTSYFAPDYRNAGKSKFARLGLTVKPVTYEVARFFRRPDSSGVIVSKVEPGGRSAVAGLVQYLLVTHVDGSKVERADDFRAKVERFEKGETPAVELTVEGFGKTRLVKIEEGF